MTAVAELHAAAVARVTAVRDTCAECGAALHLAAVPGDEWAWADEQGRTSGPAADLAPLFDPAANWLGSPNPYEHLRRLGDLCTAATGARRCETTWLYERTIREYVALKVRLDTGGYSHRHEPAREPWTRDLYALAMSYAHPRPGVIYHCETPARQAPSGWRCRGCEILLDDETASFAHPQPRSRKLRALVAALLAAEAERP